MEQKAFLGHLAGLRGLALLLVVLFHLDGSMWAQGYLGVDVFLVISGYLIFRARLERKEQDSLRDMLAYLTKRLRRILPGMLIVIMATLGLGLLLLWKNDETLLTKIGYGACLAKANAVQANLFSDYFATDAAFVPLLHMWYLSVILQLYFLYAVGNQVLQRLPKRLCMATLFALGAASLLYCYSAPIYMWLKGLGLPLSGILQAPSYYHTLPRVWEVLAGGLVCLLPGVQRRGWADAATLAGLALILLPGLGWLAGGAPCTILVVAGSVLLLRYAPESRFCALLSNKVCIWLGAISFSVYLVHMPIIVYMRMWLLGQPSMWENVCMVGLSLGIGWLFWWGIERRRMPWWLVLLLWASCTTLCGIGRKNEGFSAYLPQSNWVVPSYDTWRINCDAAVHHGLNTESFRIYPGVFGMLNTKRPYPEDAPLLAMGDDAQRPSCLLMGDSHAMCSYAGLDQALREERLSGVYLSAYICPFRGWIEDKKMLFNADAQPWERALLHWLEMHPEITHIIIAQRWHLRLDAPDSTHVQDLRTFLTALREMKKCVILIGPTPEFPPQAAFLHFDKILDLRGMSNEAADAAAAVCTRESYEEKNKIVLPLLRELQKEGLCKLIEPLSTLAPGEVFLSVRGGKLQMFDGHHMCPEFSIRLMQALRPALRAAMQPLSDEKQK